MGCLVTVTCLVCSTGKSGDCSVVRDKGKAVPNAPLRLLPEGPRAPPTLREDRLPSALAQRHSHIKCRLYLDTRDLRFSLPYSASILFLSRRRSIWVNPV